MKLIIPWINNIFDTEGDYISTIIIENQRLFTDIITDMCGQMQGCEGKCVIADNNRVLNFARTGEVLQTFIPFSLNTRLLLGRINSAIENEAIAPENYARTKELMGSIETFLYDISQNLTGDFSFGKLSIGSIIKASGVELNEDYELLGEKIIDYMELVKEFDQNKLFITINLRSYIDDAEAEAFIDTVKRHKYNLIMIEGYEHPILINEKRYIVDSSLCEILI